MTRQLEIIVKTTRACNARCTYCSAASHPEAGGLLDPDVAEQLVLQAVERARTPGHGPVRILWHGGEPLLLGKDFFRRMATLHEPGEIAHRIQTNLTLLDEEWIDVLQPLIGSDGIGTSVDPFHPFRALDDGQYNEAWLRGMRLTASAGWRVGCVYVLHRPGVARAADLYWFFRNLRDNAGVSLRVNPLLRVGRARGGASNPLALESGDYGAFLKVLAAEWLRDHKRLVVEPLHGFQRALAGDQTALSCDLAGRPGCVDARLGVDANGHVYNCGRAVDARAPSMGDLRTGSLESFVFHPDRQVLVDREPALLQSKCGTCAYWSVCHGGCPYESHSLSSDSHEPTVTCADYLDFLPWFEDALRAYAPTDEAAVPPAPVSRIRGTSEIVVPAAEALAPGQRRTRVRVTSEDEVELAATLAEARRPARLELPTSLYPAYERMAKSGRRVVAIERFVLDQPAFEVDVDLVDHVIRRRLPIWIPPTPTAIDDACQLAAVGVPVALDDLLAWTPEDLVHLAEAVMEMPNAAPIEPLRSTRRALLHDGPPHSLLQWSTAGPLRALAMENGEAGPPTPVDERWTEVSCVTCPGYKTCRGLFLRREDPAAHCDAWQRVVAVLSGYTATPANTEMAEPSATNADVGATDRASTNACP